MGDEYGGSSQNLLRAPYWESASHRAQKTVRVESANALRSFGGIWGGGGVGRHLGCGGAAKAERRRCAQIQVAPIAVPPPSAMYIRPIWAVVCGASALRAQESADPGSSGARKSISAIPEGVWVDRV